MPSGLTLAPWIVTPEVAERSGPVELLASWVMVRSVAELARVEFVDSYGIGEMVRSYSVVRQTGGEMKLASVNQKVLEVLEISRLNTIFDIHPREATALQVFGERA